MTIDRPYPTSGYLVHAAFGVRPYEGQGLPIMERDLPASFTGLDEDEQDRRMDAALSVVWGWAEAEGADRTRVEVTSRDREVVRQAGLHATDGRRGFCFGGPFRAAAGMELLAANPERVWVWAGDRLLVFVYETWDTVVVQLPASQSEDFAAQIAVAIK